MNRKELISLANDWFDEQEWKPFAFQKQTWTAFLQGKHGLLNAPTGSGKTYALWVPIVLDYIKKNPNYRIKHKQQLTAIWVTPLRALSHEIAHSARRFAEGMGTSLTIGVRTGDTSSKERAAQSRKMPDLLITTPESLQLMLASKSYKQLSTLSAVVVDEWHELLGSKRGVQMELALSRIKTLAPYVRIWGISATIGNLDQAKEVLLAPGSKALHDSVTIIAKISKKIEVRSIIPKKMSTFPWRGHLGIQLLDDVLEVIKKSKTSLIFTNTRAQCEIWHQKLLERDSDLAGALAMHHGSIDKKMRLWVEDAIRDGRLQAVVCTSSLDLGVDFAPVETIVQIGSPKGVARFLQRAGRSGHQPGKKSLIYFLPTHAVELVEASALQRAVSNTVVEDRVPFLNSYGVLVQYLTTLAVADGFYPDQIFEEVRQTFCFQGIDEEQWQWILNFLTLGSQSLQAYDDYRRVGIMEDGLYKVTSRRIAMRHRLQIGTIVSDAVLKVKYMNGAYIGAIEEWFISKINVGDVFTFAGRSLELFRIKGMDVLVKKSNKKASKIPSWMGGRLSFSARMSNLLRQELYNMADYLHTSQGQLSKEMRALLPIFQRQMEESTVPMSDHFLIETFKTREGYHALFYPFEGRAVHEAMASIIAYRLSQLYPITLSLAYNDYGFELLSDQVIDIQQVIDHQLFSPLRVHADLKDSLNATEMAKRKFRDIAVISGLVFTGYPDKIVKSKHLQSSSQVLFDVFGEYEPDNLLYQQAFVETFDHQLEEGRLQEAMQRINQQQIKWKKCSQPTPFSFPIITDRLREKMSSEKLIDRIKRMTAKLEK